jgi:N-acylglucosamine 2-epimerase
MEYQRRQELKQFFLRTLIDDVIPFWLTHSLDHDYGGYFNNLDRSGSVYDTDKAMWPQGRGVWLYSTLYNTLEPPRNGWMPPDWGTSFLSNTASIPMAACFFK